MSQLSKALGVGKPTNKRFNYPNAMKRNARYRGQRESEKTLNDHQEQIYDIRKIYSELASFTKFQNIVINSWFIGELEANLQNLLIEGEKVFEVASGVTEYPLITGQPVRSFQNVMVKLDEVLVGNDLYKIEDGTLKLDPYSIKSSPSTLWISFTAFLDIPDAYVRGVDPLLKKMLGLDERLKEAERRYEHYENAYE